MKVSEAYFLIADNDIVKDIKYGGIIFSTAEESSSAILPYKEHISIKFNQGASFSDPSNLLEEKKNLSGT